MGIRCEKVYLYGSHARGVAREGSDIDLIVVSPDWASMTHRERLELLGVAAAHVLEPIQAQGFTAEEISDHQVGSFLETVLNEEAIPV